MSVLEFGGTCAVTSVFVVKSFRQVMERDLTCTPPAPLTMPSRLPLLALCLPLLLLLSFASPALATSSPALAPARPLASCEQGREGGKGASCGHAATETRGGMLRLRGGSQAAALGVQVRDAASPPEAGLSRLVARPVCCRHPQSPADRAPAVGLQRMCPLRTTNSQKCAVVPRRARI